jgi:hypothetical protein
MDPKRDVGVVMLAPGATTTSSTYGFPGRDRSPTPVPTLVPTLFPRVTDHLVEPEVTRDIVIRGERMSVQGADEEHADAHACLDFVLLPHVQEGRTTGSDLLTRVTQGSDFATDGSVRRSGKDPQTGTRYLEELSFEVINEQSDAKAKRKVEDLALRGVRRIFAIFVKRGQVCEWSKTKKEFVTLDLQGVIEDSALIRPISVRALLDRAHAESDVAKALIQKNNPEIIKLKREAADEGHKKGVDEGHKKGIGEGRRAMLLELLADEFGDLPVHVITRVNAASMEQVRGWTKRLRQATSLEDVFVTTETQA